MEIDDRSIKDGNKMNKGAFKYHFKGQKERKREKMWPTLLNECRFHSFNFQDISTNSKKKENERERKNKNIHLYRSQPNQVNTFSLSNRMALNISLKTMKTFRFSMNCDTINDIFAWKDIRKWYARVYG